MLLVGQARGRRVLPLLAPSINCRRLAGFSAKDQCFGQSVSSQTPSPVHPIAGTFTGREQAVEGSAPAQVCFDAADRPMSGWIDRHRLFAEDNSSDGFNE